MSSSTSPVTRAVEEASLMDKPRSPKRKDLESGGPSDSMSLGSPIKSGDPMMDRVAGAPSHFAPAAVTSQ